MLNNIIIMGRLVADPELKKTANGISVCSARIACERDKAVEGGQKTDFIDIVAWRATAEFISKYFQKGKPILVCGRLQMRQWQDKDGNKRVSAEILAEKVEFCGGEKVNRPIGGAPNVDAFEAQAPGIVEVPFDNGEELPF